MWRETFNERVFFTTDDYERYSEFDRTVEETKSIGPETKCLLCSEPFELQERKWARSCKIPTRDTWPSLVNLTKDNVQLACISTCRLCATGLVAYSNITHCIPMIVRNIKQIVHQRAQEGLCEFTNDAVLSFINDNIHNNSEMMGIYAGLSRDIQTIRMCYAPFLGRFASTRTIDLLRLLVGDIFQDETSIWFKSVLGVPQQCHREKNGEPAEIIELPLISKYKLEDDEDATDEQLASNQKKIQEIEESLKYATDCVKQINRSKTTDFTIDLNDDDDSDNAMDCDPIDRSKTSSRKSANKLVQVVNICKLTKATFRVLGDVSDWERNLLQTSILPNLELSKKRKRAPDQSDEEYQAKRVCIM